MSSKTNRTNKTLAELNAQPLREEVAAEQLARLLRQREAARLRDEEMSDANGIRIYA